MTTNERVLLSGYQLTLDYLETDLREILENDIDFTKDLKTYKKSLENYYSTTFVGVSCMLYRIEAFKKTYLDLIESQES